MKENITQCLSNSQSLAVTAVEVVDHCALQHSRLQACGLHTFYNTWSWKSNPIISVVTSVPDAGSLIIRSILTGGIFFSSSQSQQGAGLQQKLQPIWHQLQQWCYLALVLTGKKLQQLVHQVHMLYKQEYNHTAVCIISLDSQSMDELTYYWSWGYSGNTLSHTMQRGIQQLIIL